MGPRGVFPGRLRQSFFLWWYRFPMAANIESFKPTLSRESCRLFRRPSPPPGRVPVFGYLLPISGNSRAEIGPARQNPGLKIETWATHSNGPRPPWWGYTVPVRRLGSFLKSDMPLRPPRFSHFHCSRSPFCFPPAPSSPKAPPVPRCLRTGHAGRGGYQEGKYEVAESLYLQALLGKAKRSGSEFCPGSYPAA